MSPSHSFDRILVFDLNKCMEYFNIIKWKNCVEKLDEGYDCCGVCHVEYKYFLGNFWWANSSHIKTLVPVKDKDIRKVRTRIKAFWYTRWLFNYELNFIPNPQPYCFFRPTSCYFGQRRLLPEEYLEQKT